jgi:hypothetical protein
MHELNARVQRDPAQKRAIIQSYYAEQVGAENVEAADMALIVKDIVDAGGSNLEQSSHLKVATPILIVGMCLGTLACLGVIGIGGYATFKGQAATTQMNLFGNSISTQSVGVALIFIGGICLVMIIRKAFSIIKFRK